MEIQQRYEAALEALVGKLRQDPSILAAILMGSLAYDTVWQKSDIDLMLVTQEGKLKSETFTLVEDDITIHAYLQTRSGFKREMEGALDSSFLHSLLMKGRLLFTRDETIPELFARREQVGARDREIQLLRAGIAVLPALSKAEKWYHVRQDMDYCFFWIMKMLDDLARIETILNNEVPGREVVQQALRHNPAFFRAIYSDLIHTAKTPEAIRAALDTIQDYLRKQAPLLFRPVLDYLSEAGTIRSTTEINFHFAKQMNAQYVDIACEWLAEEGLIQRVSNPLRLTDKSKIEVDEAAYYLN